MNYKKNFPNKITKGSLVYLIFFTLSFFLFQNAGAQEIDTTTSDMRKYAPNLFFDCDFCDINFYKQNLPYINFVRDRRMADIYLLLTLNTTGSKGTLYKLFLVGEKKFQGQNDTLEFEAEANMASADIREGIITKLKNGLLKYVVQTKLVDHISFTVDLPDEKLSANKVKDKWNLWTFSLSADFFGSGNSYSRNYNINYFGSANRTTEKIKTETGGWYNMNQQEYKINDTTTVQGFQSNSGMYHFLAFSVGKHFALGQFATYFKSTPQNLNHSVSYYPGIEYNYFTYEEASRRQLRLIYRLGGRFQEYNERTVYDKMTEWYGLHSLVFQYVQIEKWGSINISAGGWHYLNYSKNYSASIYPSISLNPLKGLRVNLWCGFQIVNDQFFLRASEVSPEEILLNQVNLKTDFNFNIGGGIGYTFGSRYNSIVNVRFDLNENYW
ncbi:MAG: hypothetical protein ACK5AY_12845 [Bacteroidota bacterium]